MMNLLNKKRIKSFVTCLCSIIVTIMVGYWCYKYEIEDRDIGVVSYVPVKDATDIKIPVVSLCFKDPFVDKKLKQIDFNITRKSYIQYLRGEFYDDMFEEIDYHNVTIVLAKYFLYSTKHNRNETLANWDMKIANSTDSVEHVLTFSGIYANSFLKCYWIKSLTELSNNLKAVRFYYDKKKLLDDWRQYIGSELRFYMVLHYPGQFFLRTEMRSADMTGHKFWNLMIKEFEILRQRNKKAQKCIESTDGYDSIIYEEHLRKKGCYAPYIKPHNLYQKCSNLKDINESQIHIKEPEIMGVPKACKRISKTRITYSLGKNKFKESDLWYIKISYPREVKIITQSKEVDFHSLIGNIGGYLGLFLGKYFL